MYKGLLFEISSNNSQKVKAILQSCSSIFMHNYFYKGLFNFKFQFSLLHKRENSHSEGIWACAWGHYVPKDKSKESTSEDKEQENGEENKENEENEKDRDNLPDT